MKNLSPSSPLLQDLSPDLQNEFPTLQISDLANLPNEKVGPLLVVSESMDSRQLVEQILMKDISNILQKNPTTFDDDVRVSSKILMDTDIYFKQQALCLVSNPILSEVMNFSTTKDKAELKTKCFEFLGTPSRIVEESFEAIFEELYMNAIFDAPAEAKKQGQPHDLYEKGSVAKLTLARNETRLAIGCADPFGSLDISRFLKRLHQVLEQGAGNVLNMSGEGGAGIGCSIIIEHATSLFLGVIPRKMTVVACTLPLGLSYRQRAKLQKSLHVIKN